MEKQETFFSHFPAILIQPITHQKIYSDLSFGPIHKKNSNSRLHRGSFVIEIHQRQLPLKSI